MNKDAQFLAEAYDKILEEGRSAVKRRHKSEHKELTAWLLNNGTKQNSKEYKTKMERLDHINKLIAGDKEIHGGNTSKVTVEPTVKAEPREDVVEDETATCTQCGDAGHTADNCPENGNAV